jgi:hypothetical protein
MPLLKGKGRQTFGISQISEGENQYLRLMRDGSIIKTSWLMSKAIEGKVFAAHAGVLTTPVTFNGTIDAAEPDLLVTVPTGTTIIPVLINVCFEDTGSAAVQDVFAVASNVYDNSVTATASTIYNYRTDQAAAGSKCTAYSVVTSTSGTTPESGNFIEFWRPYSGFAEDAFNSSTSWGNNAVHGSQWHIGDAKVPPIIKGTGSLSVYASAQAGTGFITAVWVEENTANLL